jgi:hypothetical protein
MPVSLLASRPFTADGYNGEGLCLAFGLLGRNKGLRPGSYVFDLEDALKRKRGITRNRQDTAISADLENSSSWSPRPNKVMRSYYAKSIDEQFGTLPKDFRNVATEISLIFLDIQEKPLRTWLMLNLDQQSMEVNHWMSCRPIPKVPRPKATPEQLYTLYRASYTSMVLSLNYLMPHVTTSSTATTIATPARPDLICFALLWLADHAVKLDPTTGQYVEGPGIKAPEWWGNGWVKGRLLSEYAGLKEGWREPAAWLLGLKEFPAELDAGRWPEWPDIRYSPLYTA